MRRNRRRYSVEFKREATAMAESLESTAQAAENLGIPANTLYRWTAKYGQGKAAASEAADREAAELRQLRREVKQLKLERDFLKKAAAFFAQETGTQDTASRKNTTSA